MGPQRRVLNGRHDDGGGGGHRSIHFMKQVATTFMVIGIPTVVNAMEHFWWKCRYSTKQEEFAISKAFFR